MKNVVIPKFSSEAQEAAWWDSHRSEIEAEIRQRMEISQIYIKTLLREILTRNAGGASRESDMIGLAYSSSPEVTKVSLASSKSASDNGGKTTDKQRNPDGRSQAKASEGRSIRGVGRPYRNRDQRTCQ